MHPLAEVGLAYSTGGAIGGFRCVGTMAALLVLGAVAGGGAAYAGMAGCEVAAPSLRGKWLNARADGGILRGGATRTVAWLTAAASTTTTISTVAVRLC